MNNKICSTIFIDGTKRPKGEPAVWFTAMGLTVGITMIVSLLAMIFVKGIEVFWPDSVAVIELNTGSQSGLRGSNLIAGEITKKQIKMSRRIDTEAGRVSNDDREWQLFIGNKDIYGVSFKFIEADEINRVSYPPDLMRIVRLEYGDAIAFPIGLKLKSGEMVDASSERFTLVLRSHIQEINARWDKIKKIEKVKIGKINLSMRDLRLEEKKLAKSHKADLSESLQRVQEKLQVLQEQYLVLAAEARSLRNRQVEDQLVYRTVTGQEKSLPTGNVVRFFYPNAMNVWQRIGLFWANVWEFLVEEPREANTEGGVFPAIFGTFVMTVLMSIAVMPFGVLAAIYLREYAKQGILVRSVRIAVNNLAGVPSIVFGVFGLGFFVYLIGGTIDQLFFSDRLPTPTFGTGGILWASLTLALLTVPVVIVATEEAIAAVPRGMREGSLACGASRWQTIYQIVLPAAAPGILTGLILAMARGASEVAPLMLVGVVKLAPTMPLDNIFPFFHLERKFMHLGFHIYDLGFQSPDSEAAKPMVFATTLLLIMLVVLLNVAAIYIRNRLRKKYVTGVF